jgi:hypothetical protein
MLFNIKKNNWRLHPAHQSSNRAGAAWIPDRMQPGFPGDIGQTSQRTIVTTRPVALIETPMLIGINATP